MVIFSSNALKIIYHLFYFITVKAYNGSLHPSIWSVADEFLKHIALARATQDQLSNFLEKRCHVSVDFGEPMCVPTWVLLSSKQNVLFKGL